MSPNLGQDVADYLNAGRRCHYREIFSFLILIWKNLNKRGLSSKSEIRIIVFYNSAHFIEERLIGCKYYPLLVIVNDQQIQRRCIAGLSTQKQASILAHLHVQNCLHKPYYNWVYRLQFIANYVPVAPQVRDLNRVQSPFYLNLSNTLCKIRHDELNDLHRTHDALRWQNKAYGTFCAYDTEQQHGCIIFCCWISSNAAPEYFSRCIVTRTFIDLGERVVGNYLEVSRYL